MQGAPPDLASVMADRRDLDGFLMALGPSEQAAPLEPDSIPLTIAAFTRSHGLCTMPAGLVHPVPAEKLAQSCHHMLRHRSPPSFLRPTFVTTKRSSDASLADQIAGEVDAQHCVARLDAFPSSW